MDSSRGKRACCAAQHAFRRMVLSTARTRQTSATPSCRSGRWRRRAKRRASAPAVEAWGRGVTFGAEYVTLARGWR
eukprot:3138681-Alexandrium_andersonii.AAC.1